MLTVAALVLVASSALAAPAPEALPSSSVMPLVVGVTAASDISTSLVSALLKESDAVWRAAGFRFQWDRHPRSAAANLHVIIGGGISPPTAATLPLAWIAIGEDGMPEPRIYVSYANALALLRAAHGSMGAMDTMPILQRETYLARALGRALAHEVGHYLMGSKTHAAKGLMMATHTAAEFFAPERHRFGINADERQRMAARFTSIYVAARG